MKKLFPCLSLLLLAGCMKDELPVPAHEAGDVTTASLNMEFDYRYQLYYSLSENKVVGQNLKVSWDLGFETSQEGYRVILNGAKAMYALPLPGKSELATVTPADIPNFEADKVWDAPSGNLDSTAIGDWRSNGAGIYVLDRGYNPLGLSLGKAKIQIKNVTATSYTIAYGALNATTLKELVVTKDSNYNFVFLNLDSLQTTLVEPPKKDWDLVFTSYTHTFYEPSFQSYLVTGCLLNRYQTRAALLPEGVAFDAVDFGTVSATTFSDHINTIGYDWKEYTGSTYVTYADKVYLIADQHGFYYKLHFIDYLSSGGVKGYPKWEFQQL